MKSFGVKHPGFLTLLFCLNVFFAQAQAPQRWTSGDIYEGIQKLNFLGSALYLAAHPDDENTTMIAYLANERKARTAYLSMTRGDGGQNLIGPEIRELLGIIRTQELLAARRIDGGQQFFTRANDFGFSKHPDETFRIWNEAAVLADVVWAIRKWRPDVIINRFDHRSPGSTHGHHTGSAMLSVRAFDLAGDPSVYPEQLAHVAPWQPERAFFNTSWWFYGSQEAFNAADKTNLLSIDLGVYYPQKGLSNTEISAMSRSMHKCQGFGRLGTRGSSTEYIELIKGSLPPDKEDLFAGINTTWSRVEGGAPIGELVSQLERDYQMSQPAAAVPALLAIYEAIQDLPEGYWRDVKLAETKTLIEAAMGLFLEAVADDYSATPGQQLELAIELINRSAVPATLKSLEIMPLGIDTSLALPLNFNTTKKLFRAVQLPDDLPYSNPYWLNEQAELGMYNVQEQLLRGLPETPRPLRVAFNLDIAGIDLRLEKDVVFKRPDPVAGEVYRPFEVVPPVTTSLPEPVYIFAEQAAQEVKLVVKAERPGVNGKAMLKLPAGWQAQPESIDFALTLKGESVTLPFELFPPEGQSVGQLTPVVELVDGQRYQQEMILIEYDHIPTQTVLRDAQAKVVKIKMDKKGERVAYIAGAGDAIPQSLRQIGYTVDMLSEPDITLENLQQYDAVIMGVRAYNVNDNLKFYQQVLLDYVEAGGTMIVQYNTNRGLTVDQAQIGPYPLEISRDRVTVEEAAVRFLVPEHPVLNTPNKITPADFEDWVQERGLYFPNQWDEHYTAVLSSNDPGESPKDGGLLVAPYGKGHYIYTGYSWFRELPAGVPGAFRLFANMISIGK